MTKRSSAFWAEYTLDGQRWFVMPYRGSDEETAREDARKMWRYSSVKGVRLIEQGVTVVQERLRLAPQEEALGTETKGG